MYIRCLGMIEHCIYIFSFHSQNKCYLYVTLHIFSMSRIWLWGSPIMIHESIMISGQKAQYRIKVKTMF
jgi:hypothetical protein